MLTSGLDTLWKIFAIAGPVLCLVGTLWLGWGFELISLIVGMFL